MQRVAVYASEIEKYRSKILEAFEWTERMDCSELSKMLSDISYQIGEYEKVISSIEDYIEDAEENKTEQAEDLKTEAEEKLGFLYDQKENIAKIKSELDSTKNDLRQKLMIANESLQHTSFALQEYLSVKLNPYSSVRTSLNSCDAFEKAATNPLSSIRSKELERQISQLGDVASQTLSDFKKAFPEQYENALEYVGVKNFTMEAIYDLKRWIKHNYIPGNVLSKSVLEMTRRIYSSSLKDKADEISRLPKIRLTQEQEDKIWQDQDFLMQIVKETTGKDFRDGFQEFFIRLTKNNNKRQMERLWNFSNTVKNTVKNGDGDYNASDPKNKGIRLGGYHEWLMCENFGSFLYDKKWGRDGAYLVILMTELIQKTQDVSMSNVTVWNKEKQCYENYGEWSHSMECSETRGNCRRAETLIHNTIRDCVEKSESAAELLVNLKNSIRSSGFSEETIRLFEEKLDECLR